jgi:hypothetical protein
VIAPADSESWIFRSGLAKYSWWMKLHRVFEYDKKNEAPDGWCWVVTPMDLVHDREGEPMEIGHSEIANTIGRIATDRDIAVSFECRRQCRLAVGDDDARDLVEFGAAIADEVLQVVVYEEVFFGEV